MKNPITADQLNAWIQAHFRVLEGASGAFLQLPITIYTGVNDGPTKIKQYLRFVFSTLTLSGREEDCVREITCILAKCVTKEQFQDADSILLLRNWFTYRDGVLFGRLTFWEQESIDSLCSSRAYKVEGGVPRTALEIGESIIFLHRE